MPLYEYQCEACGHRFEVIQKFSDSPLETCPKCGGVVRKLLSSPAIQFKGSGWYITDYARAGKSDPARSDTVKSEGGAGAAKSGDAMGESAGQAKTESKTESTTESKTDTKTETKSEGGGTSSSTPSTS